MIPFRPLEKRVYVSIWYWRAPWHLERGIFTTACSCADCFVTHLQFLSGLHAAEWSCVVCRWSWLVVILRSPTRFRSDFDPGFRVEDGKRPCHHSGDEVDGNGVKSFADAADYMALCCTVQLTPAQPFVRVCDVSGLARSRPNATPWRVLHGPQQRFGQDRVRRTASGEASLD